MVGARVWRNVSGLKQLWVHFQESQLRPSLTTGDEGAEVPWWRREGGTNPAWVGVHDGHLGCEDEKKERRLGRQQGCEAYGGGASLEAPRGARLSEGGLTGRLKLVKVQDDTLIREQAQ